MAPLPDTWVVVRTLQPRGRRTVQATGWVLDARTSAVVPLASFTGTFPEAAVDAVGDAPVLDPLTGASDGTTWTASYAASVGRLGLHDPLADLDVLAAEAPDGWEGDQATYTVAGWWRDQSQDPLAARPGARAARRGAGRAGLEPRPRRATTPTVLDRDPRLARLRAGLGLDAPDDAPATAVVGADGRKVSARARRRRLRGRLPGGAGRLRRDR